MRKIAVVLAIASVLLVVVGCGGQGTESADETSTSLAPSGGLVTTSSSDTTASTAGGSGATSSKVFEPNQLLSAEEASAIAGHPITMDEGTLNKDAESGVISERYKYDLGSSTVHALVEIHQDSLKESDGSVKDAFLFERDLIKDDITAVDLGDDAFTLNNTGQLHLLYDGYYIVVAFDADEYDSSKNAPLNTELGKKILENLKAKL